MNGIERLHDLRDDLDSIGAEMAEQRPRFHRLRDQVKAEAVSGFNLFQTPEHLAERMASMIPEDAQSILEPSAGLGRLYRAARTTHKQARMVLVDSSADCCKYLYRFIKDDEQRPKLVQRDFLDWSTDDRFDCVLMNPPYKQGRDIKHIARARELLNPGGVLIGLCLDGSRQNKKLRPLCDSWEPLGPDVFKAEGTRAPVVLLTIEA